MKQFFFLCALLFFALSRPLMAAAEFKIQYLDDPLQNYGFYATAQVNPTGNNPGTTLGEQRRIAFEHAIATLSTSLSTTIPIHIEALFERQGGTAMSAGLASAGPEWYLFDFAGAPVANLAYPSALANKLSKMDLSDESIGTADINIIINSDIDGDALGNSSYYYGLDNSGSPMDVDFIAVVSHEVIHGLGFVSAIDLTTGRKFECNAPICVSNTLGDVFSKNIARVTNNSPIALFDMSQEQRLEAVTADNQVVWIGAAAKQKATTLSQGTVLGYPKIYAPSTVEFGSTLSHTDTSLSPADVMEPNYTTSLAVSTLSLAMLSDLGWGKASDVSINITSNIGPTGSTLLNLIIANNGNNELDEITTDIRTSDGRIIIPTADSSFSCVSIQQNHLRCKLSQLSSGQITQRAIPIRNSAPASVTVTISSDIVDTEPNNNTDTIVVAATVITIIEEDTDTSTSNPATNPNPTTGSNGNSPVVTAQINNPVVVEGGSISWYWLMGGLILLTRRLSKRKP